MIELKKEKNELCERPEQPPRYLPEFAKETKRLRPSEATSSEGVSMAQRLHAEVESRFGVLPNFFRLAPESPNITAKLWDFAQFAYLDNPLPSLFKERLFVYLSRFCEVRYCIVRHLGFLVGLGRPSGDEHSPVQTIEEVLRLLRRTLPRGLQAEAHIARCTAPDAPLAALPSSDSDMEEAIFTCAAHAFLQTADAPRCLIALKRALGEVRFEHLIVFLGFVRTAHYWTMAHTELVLEEDVKELLATQEVLAECLLNDSEAGTSEISQELMNELASLRESKKQHDESLRAHQVSRESEERLRHRNAELAEHLAELQTASSELEDSRRAALNLMEDALQARQLAETLNVELRKENSERSQADEALREPKAWLTGQSQALAVALNAAPLETSLGVLVRTAIEQLGPDTRAAFYLANTEGTSLHHVVGMSAAYAECVDGFTIGTGSLACGLATHTGEPVLTSDVTKEPLWQPWLWLAERFDYRGCWSFPVHTSAGKFVGTFAVYSRQPREPTQRDRELASALTHTAAIIISRHAEVEERKQAQEDLHNLTADLERRVAERTEALQQANAALLREIEERKNLEEQLLQAQKMESIGTLAGGIAHDFNNILNIIQAYACTLRGNGTQSQSIDEGLSVIDETVQRGSNLVQQLLTLARRDAIDLKLIDANLVIQEIFALIAKTFPKTIELRTVLEVDLPSIRADENQIEQALLNICVNARDAMPNGGRLTCESHSIDRIALQGIDEAAAERYVCIEVSDTGIGMKDSVRERIFEPFFTTKDTGHGTGLGLSAVYGIVKNHNGFIRVESQPNAGTSFRLYFPVAANETTATGAVLALATTPEQELNGRGTVFLVEDEQNMLFLLEKILSRHGYKVLKASDGETALAIYQNQKETIDVVLLDIGLPKIGGRDVLSQMKESNPNIKIVVTSGYLDPELEAKSYEAGIKHFLRKPYTPDQVIKIMHSVIDQ
jgi:signal transduction histidine kinase/CheY-like chemotaxis protein